MNVADSYFRFHYGDCDITKDAIFGYVYCVLHSPLWRSRFVNNLSKELPRIPFAPDYYAYADAGCSLADLHLHHEICEEYPLQMIFKHGGEVKADDCLMGRRFMQLEDNRSDIIVSDQLRLIGIPPAAHEYVVNGRTPLEWLIDRYRIVKHKQGNIVNDPNGWFEDPRDLIKTIRQIVHVSVKTSDIVSGFPSPFPDSFKSAEQSPSWLNECPVV